MSLRQAKNTPMILIGIGSNLSSTAGGPRATVEAALNRLAEAGIGVLAKSRWYESEPVPASDQPWFVNGVARVATDLDPEALLAVLHQLEAEFGRARSIVNAARTLDLDLLAYGDIQRTKAPILPHPRLHQRAFVVYPLRDIAPDWRHPVLKLTASTMIAALTPGQVISPLALE